MNKDRRTYAPQDFDDDHCPKQDRYERLIDQADYLRDKRKDEQWEAAMEASERRKAAES